MNLKKIRLSRGLQQKELASLVGTDEPMISKFENYKCLPIPTVMALILKELGCKIEDIYEPNEVYYEQTIKPIPKKRRANIYHLTVELPDEARELFKSGALQKCGYKDITSWVNWCFNQFKKKYQKLCKKEKTSPSLQAKK